MHHRHVSWPEVALRPPQPRPIDTIQNFRKEQTVAEGSVSVISEMACCSLVDLPLSAKSGGADRLCIPMANPEPDNCRDPMGNGIVVIVREEAMPQAPENVSTKQARKTNQIHERFERWGQLMVAAQNDDRSAYRRRILELDPWLQNYFARRLPYPSADDARQEVLLAIHTSRHSYCPSRPFGAWLISIARYKWVDRVRDAAKHSALSLREDVPIGDHENETLDIASLNELLRKLKPAQEKVIRLVKLNGESIAAAAGATGQSASLVKINIHRGLKRLASIVG